MVKQMLSHNIQRKISSTKIQNMIEEDSTNYFTIWFPAFTGMTNMFYQRQHFYYESDSLRYLQNYVTLFRNSFC
jgi:hypothetical protein